MLRLRWQIALGDYGPSETSTVFIQQLYLSIGQLIYATVPIVDDTILVMIILLIAVQVLVQDRARGVWQSLKDAVHCWPYQEEPRDQRGPCTEQDRDENEADDLSLRHVVTSKTQTNLRGKR